MHLRRRARQLVGLAAALVVAAGVVALAGSPAAAHANLVATNPSSGSELEEAPDEIRLRFTERVTLAPDGVVLRDSNGAEVSTEPAAVAPEDPAAVVLPVPADLPGGSYVVSFRVVSADSHPVAGAIVFGVGVAAGSLEDVEVGGDDPALAVVFAAARWTSYAGLALLAGGLGMLVLCWPGGWVNRRARRVLLTGWLASLAGGLAVLLLQGPYAAGRSLAGTFDPALLSATLGVDYGHYVAARLVLVAVAGGLLLLGGPGWSRARTAGAVLVAAGLPATWAGTGHANASGNPLDMIAEVVHLVAMSTWFGGLALLAICLLPRSAALPPAEVTGAVRRFSMLASTAVGVLLVTGVYVAWRRVGTLEALLGTPYGRLLAFKLATMGVLLWLGSMSRSVVQRRYAQPEPPVPEPAAAVPASRSRRRAARAAQEQEQGARAQLRSSVRLEVGTAVAVLAVASVLVATPPGVVVTAGEDIQAGAGPVLESAPLDLADRTGVQVLVDPAWVGENRVVVEVVELVTVLGAATDGQTEVPDYEEFARPLDVPEVRGSFVLPGSDLGPLPVELTKTAPGVYQADNARLPTPGQWRLDITVRTTEIDSNTVQLPVPVS
jgi:copper transport protein